MDAPVALTTAIMTIGSELTQGLGRHNTAEIARVPPPAAST
jgi:hypothetical protein